MNWEVKMMKSQNLFSNPSKAWFRENVRRFWILPLMELLAYFLIAILPIIMSYSQYENVVDYTSTSIINTNFGLIALNIICPIAISVAVFSYIHGTASSTIAHSFPITRRKLYASSFWSGLLMLLVPVLLTGIMFMMISGAHISADATCSVKSSESVLTFVHCLQWIAETSIIVTFVYVMSNLAAIIAGNRVTHVLLAMLINVLPFAMLQLFRLYESQFFFGYPQSGRLESSLVSPLSHAMRRTGYMSTDDLMPELIYIAVIIVTTLITVWMYNKVQLERERSACVFPIISDIVCLIVTFIGASLVAIELSDFISDSKYSMETKLMFIAMAIPASIVFYIICRMIADGTTRIFSMTNLKKFVLYLVITAVFCCFTVFDITGYQNRIPDVSQISYVKLDTRYETKGPIKLTSRESINNVVKYHGDILAEHNSSQWNNSATDTISLTYKLKNGRTINRDYDVPNYNTDLDTTRAFGKIFYSKEFNDKCQLEIPIKEIVRMSFYKGNNDGQKILSIYPQDYSGLIAAINKDIKVQTLEKVFSTNETDSDLVYQIEISINKKDLEDATYYKMTTKNTNTYKFLTSHGYWSQYKKLNSKSN
jgi:ABC-2 type transport system permease protein